MGKESDQRSERKLPPSPKAAPWLVYPHGKDQKFQTFYNICDQSRSSRKSIPELGKNSLWQKTCHQGWLIILCDDKDILNSNYGNCFLWNPSSMETIHLPSLRNWMELDGFHVQDCVLSSPPRGTDNDESMVLFLFLEPGPEYIIAFCSVGDTEWCERKFIDEENSPGTIECFSGKLYAMCLNNPHLEIEIQHGSDTNSDKTLTVREFNISNSYPCPPILRDSKVFTRYVQSSGEIFKIQIYRNPRGVYMQVFTISIWKINLSLMALEEVKSLGDHVFFLGKNIILSCSAPELGFTKGCLYFTQQNELSLYKYEVDDKSLLLSLPCPDVPSPWFSSTWVMIPTTLRNIGLTQESPYMKCKKDDGIRKEEESEINVKNKEEDPRQKQNGVELKETKAWGNLLLNDIILLLGSYLHTLDYIHWRSVSTSHRSLIPIANGNKFSHNKNIWTVLSPWLVFSNDNRASYNFLNPLHNEKYLVNIPELLKGATICSSKGGWLLISKGRKCFLFYNPFTRATIKLPDLPDDKELLPTIISFSSVPTSSDCSVFAITPFFGGNVLILSIKRGDESWMINILDTVYVPPNTKDVSFKLSLNSPVFYQGAFYCLDCNGTLGVYDGNDISWQILVKVPPPNCNFIYKSFLVECGGDLLSVFLGKFGKWVRVFKLDMSEMVWIEVKHLGKHMLCISNTSCMSAVAPNSSMKNKIYFPRLHNGEILCYSLETGMYNSASGRSSPVDFYDSTEYLSCSWIEPNWSESSIRDLDWLSN